MESNKLALYRGLGTVKKYGIFVLVALFFLNAAALGALKWFETNDLHNELALLSERLPNPADIKTEHTFSLPDDVLSFKPSKRERRTGFYETRILNKEFLVYANPNKDYILAKSNDSIRHEVQNFAFALLILYVGEVVLLFGWWYFVRAKVRELFEVE